MWNSSQQRFTKCTLLSSQNRGSFFKAENLTSTNKDNILLSTSRDLVHLEVVEGKTWSATKTGAETVFHLPGTLSFRKCVVRLIRLSVFAGQTVTYVSPKSTTSLTFLTRQRLADGGWV